MTRKGPAKWARTMSRRLSGRNTRPKMAPQVEGKACRTKKPLKKDFRNFSLSHFSAFPNHEIGLVLPQVIEWAFASEPRSGGLQWTACSRNIGKTLRSPELLQHSLYKFSKPPLFYYSENWFSQNSNAGRANSWMNVNWLCGTGLLGWAQPFR